MVGGQPPCFSPLVPELERLLCFLWVLSLKHLEDALWPNFVVGDEESHVVSLPCWGERHDFPLSSAFSNKISLEKKHQFLTSVVFSVYIVRSACVTFLSL